MGINKNMLKQSLEAAIEEITPAVVDAIANSDAGIVAGAVTATSVATGSLTTSGAVILGTPQTLTGAGAISLTTFATNLVTTAADALTIAAGTEGQLKLIRMKTDGGDGTLTGVFHGGTTIVFGDAGDFALLCYLDAKWLGVVLSGVVIA